MSNIFFNICLYPLNFGVFLLFCSYSKT